jgi:hypothetical protein
MLYVAEIYLNTNLDEAEGWIEIAVKANVNNAQAYYVRGAIMGRQA